MIETNDVTGNSGTTHCSPAICSQCGKACGRKRLCRLRLAQKYILFLIDKELEKMGNAADARKTTRKLRKTSE